MIDRRWASGLVLLALAVSSPLRAAPTGVGAWPVHANPVVVTNADAGGLALRYDPGRPTLTPVTASADDPAHADFAQSGLLPVIDGADMIAVDGIPLPARSFTIALPPDGVPDVTITLRGVGSTGPVRLAVPARRADREPESPHGVRVHAGSLVAGGAGVAPASPVLSATVSRLRAQRVLRLVITPVAYDAVTGRVFWAEGMDVSVTWPVGAASVASLILPSGADAFEDVYRSSLLNYDAGRAWRVDDTFGARTTLALAGDSFASSAGNPWLKVMVTEQGMYRVGYAELAAAGLSAAEIGAIDPASIRVYTGGGRNLNADVVPDETAWMTQVAASVTDGGSTGRFDQSDAVSFYGWGTHGNERDFDPASPNDIWYDNPYTDQNAFWITWGGTFTEPVARAVVAASDATPGVPAAPTFTWRVHAEDNRQYDPEMVLYTPGYGKFGYRWERWFWETLSEHDQPIFFVTALPNIDVAQAVRLRARFWGLSKSSGVYGRTQCVPDHTVEITAHGQRAAYSSWFGQVAFDVDSTGFWGAAQETLVVRAVPVIDSLKYCVSDTTKWDDVNAAKQDVQYLAWYELEYQRRFVATNDFLQFTAPAGPGVQRAVLTGFTPGAVVRVFDVTVPASPREILAATPQAGEENASIVVQDTLGTYPRRYVAVADNRLTSVTPVRTTVASQDLRSPLLRGDYIVIAHPSFLGTAGALAAYRTGNVSNVPDAVATVVSAQDIYDQFGWGVVDPAAIRNFVVHAYRSWARNPTTGGGPSYVTLVGDASWDFRNYLHAIDGSKSFIPGYVGSGGTGFVENVLSDIWYVDDDPAAFGGLPDLYIGRLPVRTDAQGLVMINQKLIPFETDPEYGVWRDRFLYVADDQYAGCTATNGQLVPLFDGIGWQHTSQTEEIANNHLPLSIDVDKIYGAEYTFASGQCVKRTGHDDLIRALNDGVVGFNYIGHGWWDVLGHEQYLRIADVPSLVNGRRLFVFIAASCAVGKFDEPTTEGISETMVKMAAGGAIATFSATDLAFSFSNAALATTLFDRLFPARSTTDMRTFGTAAVSAALSSSNADQYAVLGDPAVDPGVPARGVSLDVPEGGFALSQGQLVEVSGSVLDQGTGLLDPSFSGTADLQVWGAGTLKDGDGNYLTTLDQFTEYGPVIFRGDVPVSQGRFTARFVVPADSAILGTTGRVRAYVSAGPGGKGRDGATGVTNVLVQEGVIAPDDSLDALALVFPGGSTVVAPDAVITVRVSDEHGVNLTGLPGSQINLVLDGTTYDLTSDFTYDSGSYTTGEVRFTLPSLRLGPHTVQVAASDAYGNRALFPASLTPMRFEVGEGGRIALRQIMSYMDRNSQGTQIICAFDPQTTGTQIHTTVTVYSISGRRIRTLETDDLRATSSGPCAEIYWDGLDAGGSSVASGTYLYRVQARDMATGRAASMVGKGPIIRR